MILDEFTVLQFLGPRQQPSAFKRKGKESMTRCRPIIVIIRYALTTVQDKTSK